MASGCPGVGLSCLEDEFKTRGRSSGGPLNVCVSPQGVVTAATSLITTLAQKNPDEFKTSVSLAVSRLSRVSLRRGRELTVGLVFVTLCT